MIFYLTRNRISRSNGNRIFDKQLTLDSYQSNSAQEAQDLIANIF